MSRGSYVYIVSGLFLVFLILGIVATAYNSIVLGNFDSYGVTFHESNDAGTQVVFFYKGTLFEFETSHMELEAQISDLKEQLGDIFDAEFYTVYGEFFNEYYNES